MEGEQHLEGEAAHPEADGAARGLALLLLELDEAQPAGEDERLQLVEQPIKEGEHLFSHGRDLMHHAAPATPRHREEPVAEEAKRLAHLGLALGEGLGAPPPLGEPVAEQ